jgi:hypothetical protein
MNFLFACTKIDRKLGNNVSYFFGFAKKYRFRLIRLRLKEASADYASLSLTSYRQAA